MDHNLIITCMNSPLKIILLGNIDSGKSTICARLSETQIQPQATAGIEETRITFQHQQESYPLRVIDTSGDPHFMDLIEPELLHADAVIFVFAFNNQESFDDLSYWVELAEPFTDDYTTLMVVGNKSQDKQLEIDDPQGFAEQKGMMFSEVSALYKIGIADMLKSVVGSIVSKRKLRAEKKERKIDARTIQELRQGEETRFIRVGIVGDPSLGKFRIFNRVADKFNAKDSVEPLYNGSLSQKTELFFPQDHIIVQLVDISDSQLSRLLTNPSFETPDVLLVSFSMESRKSFENMETYFGMFEGNSRFVVVGTKSDSSKREVAPNELQDFAALKASKYFQLSDKSMQFVQTLMEYIICTQPRHPKQKRKESDQVSRHSQRLSNKNPSEKKQPSQGSGFGLLLSLGILLPIGALIYYKFIRK